MITDTIYNCFKRLPAYKIYPFGFDVPAIVGGVPNSFAVPLAMVPKDFDKYISHFEVLAIPLNAAVVTPVDEAISFLSVELWNGNLTFVPPDLTGGSVLSPTVSRSNVDIGTMWNVPISHVLIDSAIATTCKTSLPRTIEVNRFMKNSDQLSMFITHMIVNPLVWLVLGKIYCLEGNFDDEKIGGVS